ncbi:MAG: hypothetical protein ACOX28_00530 [Bacilli bacterium]|jgi:hypothetical protein
MKNINRGERFSNEKYATRNQVTRELGTTLISEIWKEILEYRAQFQTQLTLRTVEKRRLNVVLTPKISDKISSIERGLTRLMSEFNAFVMDNEKMTQLKVKQTEKIISNIARRYKIDVDESFYAHLVSGNVSAVSTQELVLVNYFNALTYVLENNNVALDTRYIEELSAIFNGRNEDSYRKTEVGVSKAIIDPIQFYAPVNQIHDMIDDLLAFIQSSNAPMFVKFVAVYYYFDYIKPFEYYSEEIAVLFAKAHLQTYDLENIAAFLNIETVLDRNNTAINEVIAEVKKTADLTYLIDYMADLFTKIIDEINDAMFEIKRKPILEERYNITREQEQIAPEVNEEVKETPLSPFASTSTPLKEETEQFVPFKKTEDVNPTYAVSEQKEQFSSEVQQKIETKLEIAFDTLPVGLTELDAQKIERHLMEMDPSLSRAEAYFYARHCTMGKYYTIKQFKDEIGCAYETARTSMEHLAKSGYYRKEQFKNKFIYTPVRLRDK